MCIVIAKSSTAKPPTEDIIRRCWASNRDGAGFAYINVDKEVTVKKGFMTIEALLAALTPVLEVQGASYVIHFRIATHGTKDEVNTHPFWAVENKLAIAHNGILPYSRLVKSGEGRSDTNAFTEDILSKLPENWHTDPLWCHVIEEYMGGGNKIAVLSPLGIRLLNKSGWTEDTESGCYYSNTGFREQKSYTRHMPFDYEADSYVSRGTSQPTPSFTKAATEGTTGSNKPEFNPKQRKAYHSACARMHIIKRRGSLSHVDLSLIKEAMKDGYMNPEHVECGIDTLWEACQEVPSSTLDDLKILVGATSMKDLFQKCFDMQVTSDMHDVTTKIEIVDVEKEPRTKYHAGNTPGFLNQVVRIEISKNDALTMNCPLVRHALVTGISDGYLDYTRIDSTSQGRLAWSIVDSLSCALVIHKPEVLALKGLMGSRVQIDAFEGHFIRGILTNVDEVTSKFTLRTAGNAEVTNSISCILRLVGLDPEALMNALQSRSATTT